MYFFGSYWPLRLPLPADGVELDISGFANQSGFTSPVMKDLQRIFACLEVATPNSADQAFLTKVAGAGDFGPRVTVPMSSQNEWRRGFRIFAQVLHS